MWRKLTSNFCLCEAILFRKKREHESGFFVTKRRKGEKEETSVKLFWEKQTSQRERDACRGKEGCCASQNKPSSSSLSPSTFVTSVLCIASPAMSSSSFSCLHMHACMEGRWMKGCEESAVCKWSLRAGEDIATFMESEVHRFSILTQGKQSLYLSLSLPRTDLGSIRSAAWSLCASALLATQANWEGEEGEKEEAGGGEEEDTARERKRERAHAQSNVPGDRERKGRRDTHPH